MEHGTRNKLFTFGRNKRHNKVFQKKHPPKVNLFRFNMRMPKQLKNILPSRIGQSKAPDLVDFDARG